MIDEEGALDALDPDAVTRIMLTRIGHAIDLAHAIGAEHLAGILEQAREAAEREAEDKRSEALH